MRGRRLVGSEGRTTGGRRRIGRPPRFFPAGTDPRSLAPMEIGLVRRSAPGVGLSRRWKSAFMGAFAPRVGLRRRERLLGRRRPAISQRPLEVVFIRRPKAGHWPEASQERMLTPRRGEHGGEKSRGVPRVSVSAFRCSRLSGACPTTPRGAGGPLYSSPLYLKTQSICRCDRPRRRCKGSGAAVRPGHTPGPPHTRHPRPAGRRASPASPRGGPPTRRRCSPGPAARCSP